MKIEGSEHHRSITMDHDETIKIFVPASMDRTVVYLEVSGLNGKLRIIGGASVIDMISGQRIRDKVIDT